MTSYLHQKKKKKKIVDPLDPPHLLSFCVLSSSSSSSPPPPPPWMICVLIYGFKEELIARNGDFMGSIRACAHALNLSHEPVLQTTTYVLLELARLSFHRLAFGRAQDTIWPLVVWQPS